MAYKEGGKRAYSLVNEQFKLIRTGIDFSSFDQKRQIILITSPESGTGKSTIAANLAIAYAQKKERVLLVDADMRRPTLHKFFAKNLHMGLSNVIINNIQLEDSLQEIKGKDYFFTLLTSGTIAPNPNDLLSSERVSKLFQELRLAYDIIIIDTPPVPIVSDALILASYVDGTILVCRYGKTNKDKAKQSVDKLRHTQAKLLGCIINGTENAENYYY